MANAARCVFAAYLFIFPLLSHTHAMDESSPEEDTWGGGAPIKPYNPSDTGLSNRQFNDQETTSDAPSNSSQSLQSFVTSSLYMSQREAPFLTIGLSMEKWPKSYQFLLIQYSGEYKEFTKGKPKPEGPEIAKANIKFQSLREEYKKIKTSYNRAKIASNNEPNKKKCSDTLKEKEKKLEEIQIKVLRKFSNTNIIVNLNKILEEKNDVKNQDTTFPVEITNEIQRIESEYIYQNKKNTGYAVLKNKKIKKLPGFYLEPKELESAIRTMENLLSTFEREDQIQKNVKLLFDQGYKPEVTGYYPQQLLQWYYDLPRRSVKQGIKKTIDENYPYGEYRLRVLNPFDPKYKIKGKELVVYLKDDHLYLKIRDKDEFKIEKTPKTRPEGLSENLYERVRTDLRLEYSIPPEDKRRLLNFASFCGYLPSGIFLKTTLESMTAQQSVLRVLKSKKGSAQPSGEFLKIGEKQLEALEQSFQNLPKFMEKNDVQKEGDSQTTPSKSPFFTMWDSIGIVNLQNPDYEHTPYVKLHPHRTSMIHVFKEFHKKQKPIVEEKGESNLKDKYYNRETLKKYKKLYKKLEKFLESHIPLQFSLKMNLIEPGYVVNGVSGAINFYQAKVYDEKKPYEEIDLSNSSLTDDLFYEDAPVTGLGLETSVSSEASVSKPKETKLNLFFRVNLSQNLLKSIKYIASHDYSHLKELYLRDNSLESFDTEYLMALEILDLSNNMIKSLDGIKTCPCLKQLNLRKNKLEQANFTCEFENLNELDISHNGLDAVSFDLKLTKLKKVNVSHNQLKTLEPLKNLSALTWLKASHNQLEGTVIGYFQAQDFECSLSNVPNLTYLDLRDNKQVTFSSYDDGAGFEKDYKNYLPKLLDFKIGSLKLTWEPEGTPQ